MIFKRSQSERGRRGGKQVAIVGGGNVAIDVSRAAVRLGAESVSILYRRTRAEMPAWEEEIQAAEAEGVSLTYLCAPKACWFETAALPVCDASAWNWESRMPPADDDPCPFRAASSTWMLINSFRPSARRPTFPALKNVEGLKFTRWGTVEVDPVTYETGRKGVFAGGDLQTGPWIAIGAIAAGREAAESMVRALNKEDMAKDRTPMANENPAYRPIPENTTPRTRARMPELGFGPEERQLRGSGTGIRGRNRKKRKPNAASIAVTAVSAFNASRRAGRRGYAETHAWKPERLDWKWGPSSSPRGFNPLIPPVSIHTITPNSPMSLRQWSSSGSSPPRAPTMGHLVRLSDHQPPKKIAWLQCIGSRDVNQCDNGYCSSACCMYAIKEAVIAKEHATEELDCAIFFMDMRTHGKDFERYYDDARKKQGVRFIRSRVHTLDSVDGNDQVSLRYTDEQGNAVMEHFDLVVLSVGFETDPDVIHLAEQTGIELTPGHFCQTGSFHPVATNRKESTVCGAFTGPKDIPQSVIEAGSAAAEAGAVMSAARNTLTRTRQTPEEQNTMGQRPRVGVFVCQCGINIGGVVDVPAVRDYAASLPFVEYVADNLYTCSQDTQDVITQVIRENRLNRIVVRPCTPKTHEPLFQETLVNAGLNKYLFEMTNIRNQDSRGPTKKIPTRPRKKPRPGPHGRRQGGAPGTAEGS